VVKEPGQHRQRFVPVVVPWGLAISSDLGQLIDDDMRGDKLRRVGLRSVGTALRELVFRQTGVPLPPCRVVANEELPARHVALMMHELPVRALVVAENIADEDLAEHVMGRLLPVVGARAHEHLGISETQTLLDELEQLSPALVRQLVPKPVSLATLADILRRLAEEGVSIRDLKAILEALAQVAATEKDPLNLAEFVRSQLRRAISHRLAPGARELSVFLLEPSIEEAVRGAISRTTAGSFLTLAPAAGRDIVSALKRALAEHTGPLAPVVLTQPDIRRFIKKLIETDLPEVVVVSYAELLPQIQIQPIAKATLANL
jgi:type III secretion protein V